MQLLGYKEKKMHPQYFEGILQLRNPSTEVLDFLMKKMKEQHISIAKETKTKDGIDLYLSSRKFIKNISHKLQKQFGGELKQSPTLFSHNKQTSKDDLEATHTIASNNKYTQLITKPTNNISLSNARIKVHEKKQNDVNIALLMILCLAEAFILFSLLSKYIFKKLY